MTEIPSPFGNFGEYSRHGFIADFNFNKTQNQIILAALKNESWLDEQTRAIAVQWNVVNAWN
jgi:hypothetical protein